MIKVISEHQSKTLKSDKYYVLRDHCELRTLINKKVNKFN